MNRKQLAKYDARAKVIKALAHPARLMIVDELAEHGERCVCELTELVGTDMSTVSRHLSQLRNAGILTDEKRGTMVYYRLRVKCLTSFFSCVESVLEQNAEEHRELFNLQST
jgi:ArsR family transcriptional regulator